MRVAIVCPYAWDRFGGVQTHVASLARSLRGRGHEATVVAPQASGGEPPGEPGVEIVGRAVPIPANGSRAPVSFGPVASQGVRLALEKLQPDVVHLHEPLIPSLSLLALRHAPAPTVGTFHASAESSFGYRAATPWLERTIRRLAVRTVVSEAARVLISRYFPGDYLVTPNGVEVARFSDAAPVAQRADVLFGPPPRILFFGRIEPRKGLDVLIEAMTFLRDLEPTLIVVGSGPGERSSAARARRLGIETRWLGRIPDADKPHVFGSCDVYCAPGLGGESFGIVLLEAMAASTPVVCSDLPAFRAVAEGAAILVPPDEPRALAEALRAVVTDGSQAERLRAEGRAVARRFDWSHLAAEVERAYELAVTHT
jgi:phosphatidyl-myo-inositol alpha-mannosyltransferase